jgi:hypothetical protein
VIQVYSQNCKMNFNNLHYLFELQEISNYYLITEIKPNSKTMTKTLVFIDFFFFFNFFERKLPNKGRMDPFSIIPKTAVDSKWRHFFRDINVFQDIL